MFGYLQPYREELKIREFELYKSVYCGLCRQMGKDYGIFARMTLSYDCTLLAMFWFSLRNEEYCVNKGHCVFNPLKKCMLCEGKGEALSFAGAVSVIMSYYKIIDTIHDSGFFKRTLAYMIKPILKSSYKKAAKRYPEISTLTEKLLLEQSEAEKSNASVDKAAEPTAKMISSLCGIMSNGKTDNKVLEVFGYFLGRWIYLMDAADDLEKDIKNNNFNPFKEKHKGDISETMIYCNEVLNLTSSQLILAYDLLEIQEYKPILDNVIYQGLAMQQKRCLFDKYKKTAKGMKQ